ncbi:HesA/MoeB/ThiF family protein [Robertkochia flava]|uniref:HesA/MoeB/ThiF family protein n=1 Tax=Robertkochia flava TaxID=3447986 RepID=UPI0021D47EEB|nr:HesA/MoeB/ThiF family protein [Robertkochia marina]
MMERYARHLTLPGFGPEAQQKLLDASVLVIGAGGLGVPVLQYLNAAGVGQLGIVDADTVSLSNLHRQPLYTEKDLGKQKAEVIGNFLELQNSTVKKVVYSVFLDRENALEIISGYDLVVDASDNFATRYLVNDACVILGKPFVYGGLFGFEGQVSVFNYQGGPTYRCLYPEMPDGVVADCNTHGVLGVVPGIIGNLQALEAIKVITGVGQAMSGQLLLLDTFTMDLRKMKIRRNPAYKTITALREAYHVPSCVQLTAVQPEELTGAKDYFLLDVRNPDEYKDFHIGNSVNIPLGELEARKDELPENRSISLICQQGVRTKKAAEILEGYSGFLYELEGGINSYLARIS